MDPCSGDPIFESQSLIHLAIEASILAFPGILQGLEPLLKQRPWPIELRGANDQKTLDIVRQRSRKLTVRCCGSLAARGAEWSDRADGQNEPCHP
jgi:hypothetical protein